MTDIVVDSFKNRSLSVRITRWPDEDGKKDYTFSVPEELLFFAQIHKCKQAIVDIEDSVGLKMPEKYHNKLQAAAENLDEVQTWILENTVLPYCEEIYEMPGIKDYALVLTVPTKSLTDTEIDKYYKMDSDELIAVIRSDAYEKFDDEKKRVILQASFRAITQDRAEREGEFPPAVEDAVVIHSEEPDLSTTEDEGETT